MLLLLLYHYILYCQYEQSGCMVAREFQSDGDRLLVMSSSFDFSIGAYVNFVIPHRVTFTKRSYCPGGHGSLEKNQ